MSRGELEDLRHAAMALSDKERAKLASELMASLDGPSEDGVAEAWDIELCRRINELESGKAELLDPEDVLARARKRIRG